MGLRSFAAMLPSPRFDVVVLANSARSVHRLGLERLDPLTVHHAFVTEA
jgi:hypothetical protein